MDRIDRVAEDVTYAFAARSNPRQSSLFWSRCRTGHLGDRHLEAARASGC